MIGQIDQLSAAIARANVTLGVIPLRSEWDFNVDHGFWIFDDNHILIELVPAEFRLTQPDELATYRIVFQNLAEKASYGDDARRVLAEIALSLSNLS